MSQDDELIVRPEVKDFSVEIDVPEATVVLDDPEVVVVLAANVGPPGQQGDQGEQGEPGDPGPPGFMYVHDQGIASNSWNVAHNLNGFPNVTVVDSAGTVIEGEIIYNDSNNITLNFSSAFGGTAYLS